MKNRFYILLFAFMLPAMSVAQQQEPDAIFRVPFDFPLYLSGNFAEPRSAHFHGGLDFKTQGAEGKPVHCLEDGYISRVAVSAGGYGNALYITHTNGYTSVYGHLKSLPKEVAKRVRENQDKHETFPVDLAFDSLQFPVKRGEVVAYSGNTGYSFGPHLHLEIRKSDTEEPVNPLLFFKSKIKDTVPPRATELLFCPQTGGGVVNGGSGKTVRPILPSKENCIKDTLEVWGSIGVAVRANDYMNDTHNTYGIYSITLSVDGMKTFESRMDCFAFDENRLINSWSDFEEYRTRGRWYLKTFVEEGNTLRMLYPIQNNGRILVGEERLYDVELRLADLNDNTSVYRFVLRGRKQEIPAVSSDGGIYLCRASDNEVRNLGMQLSVPRGALFEDVTLHTVVTGNVGGVAMLYRLNDTPVPFKKGVPIKIRPLLMPVADTLKYYIQKVNDDGTYSMGGSFEDGWMKSVIFETGNYTVGIDTVPPKLTPINRERWKKSGVISFRVGDEHTGIRDYVGRIDGEFVLFVYSLKNGRLDCILRNEGLTRGKHHLQLTVTDQCGNAASIDEMIVY